jgi:TIR domain
MAAATVFVSYSHKDREALDRLKKFVRPLEREGLIGYWDDTRLAAGDDWQAEILTALGQARVAVLLISQNFLASDFIAQEEIPRILARAHDDGLLVMPVLVSPSTVASQHFTFVDASGQKRQDTLTRFQGVGTPDKTLSDLSWSEGERQYTQFSQQLPAQVQEAVPTHVAPQLSAPRLHVTPTPEPASAYALTIQLERHDARLHIGYHLPAGGAAERHTGHAA